MTTLFIICLNFALVIYLHGAIKAFIRKEYIWLSATIVINIQIIVAITLIYVKLFEGVPF